MGKSNNLSSLYNQLSPGRSHGQSGSVTNLTAQLDGFGTSGRTRVGRTNETRTGGLGGSTNARSIAFGKTSNIGNKSGHNGGGEFTGLLKQVASGGIASGIGGSLGLGSISGLGSIISGIANLFGGGKSTPPALVEFQLPTSQNQTLIVGPIGGNVHQSNNLQSAGSVEAATGTYNSPEGTQSFSNVSWVQDHNTQIAQAVKNALLQSSSLADVIAEI